MPIDVIDQAVQGRLAMKQHHAPESKNSKYRDSSGIDNFIVEDSDEE